MLTEALLPDPTCLALNEVVVEGDTIILTVRSLQVAPTCPDCHHPSEREHSRYWRVVADLPCAHRRIRLRVRVRRLFCDSAACPRQTFAERFPGVVAPSARRTDRLAAVQCQVGLLLGGEASCRVLARVAMPVSSDTVLRLIRSTSQKDTPQPRVIGIDDWAWRKGQRYGTIVVDLERHRPVDLLPDRSADTIAAWLQAHPGIEIVSRDRAPAYIDGICRGAPDAIQVADRWHLLRNLKDALQSVLEQHRACLYAAADEPDKPCELAQVPENSRTDTPADIQPLTQAESKRQATRERRLARYQAVMDLHRQGTSERAIAHQLDMCRATVHHYIGAGTFPEMSQRRKSISILDPFQPYLSRRWAEGCHNGAQLYREIYQRGYTGSRALLGYWVARLRKQEPQPPRPDETRLQPKPKPVRPWSAQYAVWLLLGESATLAPDKAAALERMLAASPAVRYAYNFGQAFLRIVRQRLSRALDPWLRAVIQHDIPELNGFARSLEQDKDAVLAALTLPWSNGQVEGQVNRLKLIKRQMYGRAKLDLLRARALAPSRPP